MKQVLTNARIVLEDEVLEDGTLTIEDGVVVSIGEAATGGANQIDLDGQFLMPGIIDLHGDALEKAIEPRPNVIFPIEFALTQIDRSLAGSGITTTYHALSISDAELGVRNLELASNLVRGIKEFQDVSLVDTKVHCRFEITDSECRPTVEEVLQEGCLDLISFMDHTPGQGQFKSLEQYVDYFTRTYGQEAGEVEERAKRKEEGRLQAWDAIDSLARMVLDAGLPLASHDDDSHERVDLMRKLGATISEFPINVETAGYAKQAGMRTIVGAPNIVRGKSQSKSMRAIDAINAGVADCLCSDYVPASLLLAIFMVTEQSDLDLPQAVKLVSTNPAQAAGLDDRGSLVVGKRADLIAVDTRGRLPQVTSTWINGQRVFETRRSRVSEGVSQQAQELHVA